MDTNLFLTVEQFSKLKVLVVGDAILESYVKGSADRLSLEAPAPVVGMVDDTLYPGGAANAAVNARAMGADVTFLSVIGNDAEGESMLQLLRARDIQVAGVARCNDRQTMLRRRIYAGTHLLVRYDQGTGIAIGTVNEDLLLEEIRRLCPTMDVVIVSDYGGGTLTPRLLEGIAALHQVSPCILVADTRRIEAFQSLQLAAIHLSYYSAMQLVTNMHGNGHYNAAERVEKLTHAGQMILEILKTQLLAITLDDDGAMFFEQYQDDADDDGHSHGLVYRTYAHEMPFNRVDGAGDAFVAGLALALAAGGDAPAAAEIASAMASLVVRRGGMSACCQQELFAHLTGDEKFFGDRVSLAERVALYRRQGKRIVFTNGVFDILHSGHVTYLNQAKSFGDVLIVGVNSDESVKRLKGPERPINPLDERMKVLAGLSGVDHLIAFGENTPVDLIEVIKPDVYVKGGDYTRETLPETPVVERLGGEIRIVQYLENHSTSGVIHKIRQGRNPARE